MSFWKKVGTGAAVGLAFGIVCAFSFFGMSKIYHTFFDNSSKIEVVEEEDDKEVILDQNDEESALAKEKDDDKEVELNVSQNDERKLFDRDSSKGSLDVSDLAKSNLPCVVSITNTSVSQIRDWWGRGVREYENISCGSGIIIGETDDELLIATNCHVVSGAKSITAGFIDDEICDASLKGSDADIDLAVIGVKKSDIKDSTFKKIKIAVIGDSDELEVGQQVVAIGNAIGYGQSVTTGIVSALNRVIPNTGLEEGYIQTDAAINPGNSGGALLNMKGELIGINSAKISSTSVEGIGYAIPMNAAKPIIENLMNRKTREKVDVNKAGYIGISGVSVDASTAKMYGIPEGVYLQNVVEDSPAEKAGLKKGDVIRKFDGVTVSSLSEIKSSLDYYEEGEKVELVIYRSDDGEYKEQTVEITLGTRKGTDLDPALQENKEQTEENEDKSDDAGKEKNGNSQTPEEFYESLPDELKDFFNGFSQWQ